MNTITPPIEADAVLNRLLAGAGLQRDTQLANLLGVTPQAVSQARRKQKVPEGWLIKASVQYGLSMDWLLFGTETPLPQEKIELMTSVSTGSVPQNAAQKAFAPHPSSQKMPSLRGWTSTPPPKTSPPTELSEQDLLLVPLVAASLSAGMGSLETENEVLDHFAFHSSWLCRKGNPDAMVLMKVYGDSMEPDICHGDMVLIDQSKQQIYPHTIYAVGVNDEIYIKQIETRPGHRMILRSFNERYDPIEVDLRENMTESVRIIGRVLWWCREA